MLLPSTPNEMHLLEVCIIKCKVVLRHVMKALSSDSAFYFSHIKKQEHELSLLDIN